MRIRRIVWKMDATFADKALAVSAIHAAGAELNIIPIDDWYVEWWQ